MPSLWSRLVRRKHRISSRKQGREDALYTGDQSVFIQKLEVRKTNWATAADERENKASSDHRSPFVSGELKIRDKGLNERVKRFQKQENDERQSGIPERCIGQRDLLSTKEENEITREVLDSGHLQRMLPILNDRGDGGIISRHSTAHDDTYLESYPSRSETSNSATPAWQRYSVPVFSTQKPADDPIRRESQVKDEKSNYVPKVVKMLDFTQILTGRFPGDQHFSEPDLRCISERTLLSSPGESLKISPTFETRHVNDPRYSREQGIGILNRVSEIIPGELCPDFRGYNQTTSTEFNSHIYVGRAQFSDLSVPITAVLHNNIDSCRPASAAGSWGRSYTCHGQPSGYESMGKIGAITEYDHNIAPNTEYSHNMDDYDQYRMATSVEYNHDMQAANIDYSHQFGAGRFFSGKQRPVSSTSTTGLRDSVTDPWDDQVTEADIDRVLAQLDKVTEDEQDNHFHQFLEGVFNQKEEVLY